MTLAARRSAGARSTARRAVVPAGAARSAYAAARVSAPGALGPKAGGAQPRGEALGGAVAARRTRAAAVHLAGRERFYNRAEVRGGRGNDGRAAERRGGRQQQRAHDQQRRWPAHHPAYSIAVRAPRPQTKRIALSRRAGVPPSEASLRKSQETATTRPPAMRTSSSGVRRNTVWGCPPAAQIASHLSRASSTSVVSGAGCARGATPPIAKPVCARTKSASARPTDSPSSAPSFASSTRLAPLVSTSR